ncbi:hypothetical protein JCM8547_007258 [Rhodosporidiobolus lusitaniae]
MAPLLSFKAGRASRQGTSNTVVCHPERGLITLEEEDGLLHFYFRSSPSSIDEDLIIFPGDASFLSVPPPPSPEGTPSSDIPRVHVLKFNSSSARHFFWSQQKDFTEEESSERVRRVNELIGAPPAEVEETGGAAAMETDDPGPSTSTSSAPIPAPSISSAAFETPAPTRTAEPQPGAPKKSAFGSEAQMAQLQNILASLGGGAGGGAASGLSGLSGLGGGQPAFLLPDVLPPTSLPTLLSSLPPSSLSRLSAFLPPSPLLPTSTPSSQLSSLTRALTSPEFKRSIGGLERALRTGATGPLMGGLGLDGRAARGTEEFLEEVERQAEREKETEAGQGGGGEGGSGGSA